MADLDPPSYRDRETGKVMHEHGLCACGCGQRTNLHKGRHPNKWILGHHLRKSRPHAALAEHQVCSRCESELPLSEFTRNSATGNGYHNMCRPCVREYSAERRRTHPESERAAQAKYYAKNRVERSERKARRRALERSTRTEARISYKAILERDGHHCHLCDSPIDAALKGPDPMSLSFDHVVPLARGGSHTSDNIKPAHLTCNRKKGASDGL